jgi:hypothetical protein
METKINYDEQDIHLEITWPEKSADEIIQNNLLKMLDENNCYSSSEDENSEKIVSTIKIFNYLLENKHSLKNWQPTILTTFVLEKLQKFYQQDYLKKIEHFTLAQFYLSK